MQVKDVMTTQLITITEDQTRQQAARLLAQHRISGLPVVNHDHILIGVVTEYDIISKEGNTVRDIMTRGIISVAADTDLAEARHILIHERIKRLPVLDQGKLIGIISRADLVREVATRWLCNICGEVIHSQEQPDLCPRCHGTVVASSSESPVPGS